MRNRRHSRHATGPLLTLISTLIMALGMVGPTAAADGDKSAKTAKTAVATFGAGCFWCTEADYDKVPGVIKTISGFMGGHVANPTYKQVVKGDTGHTEVVQITYDPAKVSYAALVEYYWRHVDPFDKTGQFCDRGSQYRPAIFVHDESQRATAIKSRDSLQASGRFQQTIVVEITSAEAFTPAEGYHQNFYKKNPFHYWRYRVGCGRDQRIEQIWGKNAKS